MLTGFFYNYDINTFVSFVALLLLLSWCHSFLTDLFLLLTSHVCHVFRWFSPMLPCVPSHVPCFLSWLSHVVTHFPTFPCFNSTFSWIKNHWPQQETDSLEVTTIDQAYFSGRNFREFPDIPRQIGGPRIGLGHGDLQTFGANAPDLATEKRSGQCKLDGFFSATKKN